LAPLSLWINEKARRQAPVARTTGLQTRRFLRQILSLLRSAEPRARRGRGLDAATLHKPDLRDHARGLETCSAKVSGHFQPHRRRAATAVYMRPKTAQAFTFAAKY
jgi:hypothetical protein